MTNTIDLKPVSGDPELRPTWDDVAEEDRNVHDCGWHLAWDCNLSVGHTLTDDDTEGIPTGPVAITVAMKGERTQRAVTGEQLITYGLMLVNLGRSIS